MRTIPKREIHCQRRGMCPLSFSEGTPRSVPLSGIAIIYVPSSPKISGTVSTTMSACLVCMPLVPYTENKDKLMRHSQLSMLPWKDDRENHIVSSQEKNK